MYLYSHTSFQKQPHDNRPKIPTKNTVDLARTKWRRLLQCVWVTWPLLCGVDRCKQLCRPSSSYGWKRVNRRTKKKPDACIGGGGGGVFAGMMMVAWISSVNQWCLGFHWVISPMTTSIGVLIIDPLDLTVWFTLFFWGWKHNLLLLRWVPNGVSFFLVIVWVIFVGSSGTIFNMTTRFCWLVSNSWMCLDLIKSVLFSNFHIPTGPKRLPTGPFLAYIPSKQKNHQKLSKTHDTFSGPKKYCKISVFAISPKDVWIFCLQVVLLRGLMPNLGFPLNGPRHGKKRPVLPIKRWDLWGHKRFFIARHMWDCRIFF